MSELRVVPGKTSVGNVMKHIARYNLALQFCENKRVLDVASGSGYGSQILSWVAKEVRAVEISPEARDYAMRHHAEKNIVWDLLDALDMDYKQPFDTIVSFETIEHIQDIEKLTDVYQKHLSPGGILVYSLPLNERPGFNEHHKHLFNSATARTVFKKLRPVQEFIQKGTNFYPLGVVDESTPFTYYVGVFAW